MLLSAAGCAQDSKRPEPTEPAASAVSETSVENVEAAEETPQKPQSSRRLDDSRISTLYDERFTYTDPYGIEDTYFYQVPQIDDDTEGARNINEMIGYRFGYLVERALDARSRNDFIDTSYIIWVSNWDGPLLSLQITSSDAMYNHDVGSYHYNFATGQELSNPEMLAHLGYTDDAKVNYTGVSPFRNLFGDMTDTSFTTASHKCSAFFIDQLTSTSDPRMAQWVRIVGSDDVHGVVSGVVEPDGTGASVMNPAVLKQYTTPVWFMTSSELFFILSEAAHTGMIPGGEAAAEAYYEQAVTNSIRQWNPSISDANIDRFLHGTGSKAAYDGTLERIIQQKWVSVFMQGFEAWCDYRRTGYPQLPIGPDVQNEGVLPTRLGYGQMLISTNGDNYRKQVARMKAAYPVVGRGTAGGDNMLTPVWWSKRALELENGAMN